MPAMSVRATRWLLFVALVLAMPFPILGPFGGLVPPVRLAILFGATAAVAATEGAAGPVPGLLTLLGVHLLASLGVAWGLAWVTMAAGAALGPLAIWLLSRRQPAAV